MCGICGIVGTSSPLAGAAVQEMTRCLERRGPDSVGEFRSGMAVLGHRRLAIYDLSAAGHQPMTTPDGRTAVVFNGAIYNFLELRAELERDGVRFASRTDTEVLLHGYRAWGIDALVRRARGMFAFALWDADRETLFLVRDRLGVKPLVYAGNGGAIAFASTMCALQTSGLVGDIDPRGIAEYLEHGYIPDDAAVYTGARKLPPATIAEWRPGTPLSLRRYWEPPMAQEDDAVGIGEATERTEELLRDAVRLRLFADVPVGALLSGGIDSALVCWAAAGEGASVTAFTVGVPGHPTDETADALATAREIGIDARVLPMSGEDPSDLAELTSAYAEPFATQSALGMLRLSRAVRDAGIKVLLTGDGGDDVFLGYARHRQMRAIERMARLVPASGAAAWRTVRPLVPPAGMLRRMRHLTDYVTGGLGAFLRAHDGLPGFARAGLLGERIRDVIPASRTVPPSLSSARRLLTEYLEHDRRHQFVGEYLTKVDGATMHCGLEARAPFFDHILWEYAASLPYATRLHDGRLKAVLRAIAEHRISARVAAGRKRGFSVPAEKWVTGPWKTAVSAQLRDGPLCDQGWVPRPALERLLAAPRTRGPGAHHLWYLLVLSAWLRGHSAAPERTGWMENAPAAVL